MSTFDSDGNMLDSNGNYVEDNDSITSSWYYQTLATQAVPVLTALDQAIPDQTAQTHLMTIQKVKCAPYQVQYY